MTGDARPRSADESLLRRFLAGDAAVCRRLESWSRQILAYRRFGLSDEDVDDIVQEMLTSVWNAARAPEFELRVGLHALVRKVTLARAVDRVRRNRVRRAEPLADYADEAPSITARLEWDEASSALFDALSRLEERCREIIRLYYFEDWPYGRIAALEGRSASTLRVRMFHCLRALRAQFGHGKSGSH